MRPFLYIFLLVTLIVISSSCRKKAKNFTRWETEMLVPLATGSMTISSLVGDTLLEKKADNSLSLVYRNDIFSLNLAQESIEIPDTSLKQVVTLDSIYLPDRAVVFPISLGRLALADTPGTGSLIIAFHGQPFPIPAISNISATDQEVDASDLFETATLDGGFLDLKIENGFPVDITDLKFQLKNKNSGNVIVIDSVALLPAGATVTMTYDLSGKTVEGHLMVDILSLSSPGSGGQPVMIDTSDALILSVTARDLDIFSATAIFPSQNLIDIKNEVQYNMNGPELTFLKIRSGKLVITAVNTIEDSLKLNYKIPGAKSASGTPINIFSVVPPAPAGGSNQFAETVDLAGYTIDLTGKDFNKVNTFYNEFTARIDSTGKIISISLDDSVSVFYGLLDIVPEYARGYLGQYNYDIGPSVAPFDIFKNVTGGTLDLEKVDLGLSIYNGMGADATVFIESVKSINSRNGNTVDLNATFVGQNVLIPRAIENPYIPGYKVFALDQNNSNIKAVIENLPDKLQYKLKMDVNPNGNAYNYQDFVNYDNEMKVTLDMEMPLHFKASSLTLQDTFDLELNTDPDKEPGIKDGTFNFYIDNGFPLDATIQLYFTSANGLVLDSLFAAPQLIGAAAINNTNCMVSEKNKVKFSAVKSEDGVYRISTAKKAVIKVVFDSRSLPTCGDKIKIYSDYGIDFNLSAKFNYRIQDL